MPEVAAVKTTPVLIALKSRTVWRKTETTNVIPMSSSHWVFWVTEPEIGGAIAEQAGGEQRLLARSLVGSDVQEEPEHEPPAERQKDDQERVVVAGLQDPEDHERHPQRGQDGADLVERPTRVGCPGIDDPAGRRRCW